MISSVCIGGKQREKRAGATRARASMIDVGSGQSTPGVHTAVRVPHGEISTPSTPAADCHRRTLASTAAVESSSRTTKPPRSTGKRALHEAMGSGTSFAGHVRALLAGPAPCWGEFDRQAADSAIVESKASVTHLAEMTSIGGPLMRTTINGALDVGRPSRYGAAGASIAMRRPLRTHATARASLAAVHPRRSA
jgi:hypothetical protein